MGHTYLERPIAWIVAQQHQRPGHCFLCCAAIGIVIAAAGLWLGGRFL